MSVTDDFDARLAAALRLGAAERWLEDRLRETPGGLPTASSQAVAAFTDRFLTWVRQTHPEDWSIHCTALVRGWITALVIGALDAEVAAGRLVEAVGADGRTFYAAAAAGPGASRG